MNAITRVIAYAALFRQAITADEIHRYLEIESDPQTVSRILAKYAGQGWHHAQGLYCLPDDLDVLAATADSHARARRLWRRAEFWARLIARVPFTRMVAVTGSLAVNNAHPSGDIDYLVVTVRGRVWLSRFCIVALTRLAGVSGTRLCPNYLLSESSLRLDHRQYFTARELRQMVPLFGERVYWELSRLNDWTLGYLPAARLRPTGPPVLVLGRLSRWFKAALEALLGGRLGDVLERLEMRRKIARLSALPGAHPPDVVLTSEQCKGHFGREYRLRVERFVSQSGLRR